MKQTLETCDFCKKDWKIVSLEQSKLVMVVLGYKSVEIEFEICISCKDKLVKHIKDKQQYMPNEEAKS